MPTKLSTDTQTEQFMCYQSDKQAELLTHHEHITDLGCHVTKTAFHISLCHIQQH